MKRSISSLSAVVLVAACASQSPTLKAEQDELKEEQAHISIRIAHTVVDVLGGVDSPVTCDEITQRMNDGLTRVLGGVLRLRGKGGKLHHIYKFPDNVEVEELLDTLGDPNDVINRTKRAYFITVGRPSTAVDPAGVFNGSFMKPCSLE